MMAVAFVPYIRTERVVRPPRQVYKNSLKIMFMQVQNLIRVKASFHPAEEKDEKVIFNV